MKKIITIFCLWLMFLMLSGCFASSDNFAHDATVEFRDTNTYECFNYEIVSNQMLELQSKWIYLKGFKRKVIERKINKLRPSVINREVLCLGRGVTPN